MTDSATLRAPDIAILQEWGANRRAERELDGFETLALKIANYAAALANEKAELERQLGQCADWLRYYTGNVSSVTADKVREWHASRPVPAKD